MKKREVATQITKELFGSDIVQDTIPHTEAMVNAFMKIVREAVANGQTITLRGFGTFKPVWRAPKKARNISAGTTVEIPGRYVPVFVPAAEFSRQVQEATTEA